MPHERGGMEGLRFCCNTISLPGSNCVLVSGWGSRLLREGLGCLTTNRVQGRLGFCFYFYCFLLKVLISGVSVFQLEYERDGPELNNNEKKVRIKHFGKKNHKYEILVDSTNNLP